MQGKLQKSLWFGGASLAAIACLAVSSPSVAGKSKSAPVAASAKITVEDRPVNRDGKLGTSYAPVVKKVSPSVVSVFTTVKAKALPRGPFGYGGMQPPQHGVGSGVIVTADGFILTNSHVVDGASELKVALQDGREFTAKVVGQDPKSDVAVVKIAAEKLPAISMANSDKIEVGDIVLAVGNPFGIGQTVTMGMVSATGRATLGLDYEDFIQTDAAINPGNSGGALVDAEGRLIGINQSIASPSGGNAGVGFAVPVNLARSVLERIVADGKVTRGYLGVAMQPEITPEIAREFKLPDTTGVLVTDVMPNSPAERAGLQQDDVIIEFNGKKVADRPHLRLMVSQVPPDTKATIKILRDGKEKGLNVTLAAQPENFTRGGRPEPSAEKESEVDGLDGVEVADLDNRTRQQFEIPPRIRGALVTKVQPDSNAADAQLRAGDVIVEINRRPVRGADDAVEFTRNVKGDRIWLRVYSPTGSGSRYLSVETSKKKK